MGIIKKKSNLNQKILIKEYNVRQKEVSLQYQTFLIINCIMKTLTFLYSNILVIIIRKE